MKKVYMFLIGFIIIGVISFSLLKDTEKKNKDNQDVLTVSGVLETNEIDVNVKVGGKLLEIMVGEGDNVKKGDIVCIIEAMKIMNPIEATQSGVVEEILVKNGEVIQFGQPLFRYRA